MISRAAKDAVLLIAGALSLIPIGRACIHYEATATAIFMAWIILPMFLTGMALSGPGIDESYHAVANAAIVVYWLAGGGVIYLCVKLAVRFYRAVYGAWERLRMKEE